MSRSNVEIVLASYEAAQRMDVAGFDLVDDDAVWDMSALGMPDLSGVYRGKQAWIEFWARWVAAWDSLAFELLNVEEVGDHVIVEVNQRNRGRGSGVDVDFHYFQTFTVREGKIIASHMAETKAEALEAVGLSE